jgi:hypothetical protein
LCCCIPPTSACSLLAKSRVRRRIRFWQSSIARIEQFPQSDGLPKRTWCFCA